jgi:hypothetical protein
MCIRVAVLLATLCLAQPSTAETLKPEAVRDFVAGKLFGFSCFEGTRGSGRIYSDGSLAGAVQIRGTGEARYVTLPAGTLLVNGESYCASIPGLTYQPCFEVERLNRQEFRGSLLGVRWAFCEFTRGSEGAIATRSVRGAKSSKPLVLTP